MPYWIHQACVVIAVMISLAAALRNPRLREKESSLSIEQELEPFAEDDFTKRGFWDKRGFGDRRGFADKRSMSLPVSMMSQRKTMYDMTHFPRFPAFFPYFGANQKWAISGKRGFWDKRGFGDRRSERPEDRQEYVDAIVYGN